MNDEWGPGDRAKWSSHGLVTLHGRRLPLIYGEHPHSRNDNRHYVELDAGREPVGFDGHRILIDVRITMENYLKESELSGDEVRKGGTCVILADGVEVFEFFTRDTCWALLHAHHLISELLEHPSGWLIQEDRGNLVGRKIFYRDVPAVISALVTSQGCLMIRTEDGTPFPRPVWAEFAEIDEGEPEVKIEITDPHVWWFRS